MTSHPHQIMKLAESCASEGISRLDVARHLPLIPVHDIQHHLTHLWSHVCLAWDGSRREGEKVYTITSYGLEKLREKEQCA